MSDMSRHQNHFESHTPQTQIRMTPKRKGIMLQDILSRVWNHGWELERALAASNLPLEEFREWFWRYNQFGPKGLVLHFVHLDKLHRQRIAREGQPRTKAHSQSRQQTE